MTLSKNTLIILILICLTLIAISIYDIINLYLVEQKLTLKNIPGLISLLLSCGLFSYQLVHKRKTIK